MICSGLAQDLVLLHLLQVPALTGEIGYTCAERMSIHPTLDVHGVWSGYTGPGTKTNIPARATAKLSMQLVHDQGPAEIGRLLTE